MIIHIVRHGPSAFQDNEKITASQFQRWILNYDKAGIHRSPPTGKAHPASMLVTSDLLRSKETAMRLYPDVPAVSNAMFREAELPVLKGGQLKLPPNWWLVLHRFLWLVGYSKDCESKRTFDIRVQAAAKKLEEYSRKHETVALIGHGILNRYLIQELKRKGWRGSNAGRKHWATVTLMK